MTFPVSVPCWVLAMLAAWAADALTSIAEGVGKLWNGKRRHLYRFDGYGYGYHSRRRSRGEKSRHSTVSESAVPAE